VGFEQPAPEPESPRSQESAAPPQYVTSRVAEAFYWIGRYMERAYCVSGMVGVIESLELEELNPTERTHYRPVWNRILPRLEASGSGSRRTISNAAGRYHLTLDIDEPGSVVNSIQRAAANAETILEALSLEAWGVLSLLRGQFQRARFRPDSLPDVQTASSRKLCDAARSLIPQFFGTAEATMVADGAWKFCEIGQLIERAAITANAIHSISSTLLQPSSPGKNEHAMEIRLSAFLRLLNTRDVYRRVYQMRIEPVPLLDLLWKNPVAPRSVSRCLRGCVARISESEDVRSPATGRSVAAIESLISSIQSTDWEHLLHSRPRKPGKLAIEEQSDVLLTRVLGIHDLIADGFLNHQIHMRRETQPLFPGS
jgi:uncharacterized alpha-E superfamily protein